MEDGAMINAKIDIEDNEDDGDNIEEGGLETFVESTPPSHVPSDPSFENIANVSSPISSSSHALDTFVSYHLPFRHNRDKPPARYS